MRHTAHAHAHGQSRSETGDSSSRSSMSTTPSVPSIQSSKRASRASDLPTLDFLENDVGLWDAFFTKTSSKHQSVLRPAALPVDEYLQDHLRRGGEHQVRDLSSLRVLLPSSQKHLAAPPRSRDTRDSSSPIRQI